MKGLAYLLSALMLAGTLIVAKMVFAADQAAPAAASTSKKSTNMSFEDLLIQGKYHFSDEAVITVEQDKVLDALLGVRKDFKDRLQQSVSKQ